MQNRGALRTILVIALSLPLFVGGAFFAVYQHSVDVDAKNASFRMKETRSLRLNEPLLLDSRKDKKGMDYGYYVASFPWEGAMELTVLEAHIYETIEDIELISKNFNTLRTTEDVKYLMLKVRLRNIDAKSLCSDSDEYAITSFVSLRSSTSPGFFPTVVCFDGSESEANEKDWLYFSLGEGSEKSFLVGFKVPEDAQFDDLYVGTGLSCMDKYTIKLSGGGNS